MPFHFPDDFRVGCFNPAIFRGLFLFRDDFLAPFVFAMDSECQFTLAIIPAGDFPLAMIPKGTLPVLLCFRGSSDNSRGLFHPEGY